MSAKVYDCPAFGLSYKGGCCISCDYKCWEPCYTEVYEEGNYDPDT